jgi:hypothetical protein
MTGDVQIKQFEVSETEALLSFLRVAFPGERYKGNAAGQDDTTASGV